MQLGITSPHTKNGHVKALQNALIKAGYLDGTADGEFGEKTSVAVYRAKYWLGYRKPDHVAADLLYNLLTGKAKPSLAMKARIKNRKKIASQKPLRVKAFEEAKKHIGEKERTGNNDIFYTDWYGMRGAWCAMFVTYCYVKAGSKTFQKGSRYAYVPYIVQDARRGINHLTITREPKLGDIVCYDWDGGVADHTGLFEKWIDRSKGIFSSIEGNTSGDDSGSQSNGGMVAHRRTHPRYLSNVQAFVRVGE